jgi:uncharacterized protein YqgC (DUF456 family)
MITTTNVLVLLLMLVGTVGIVVPVLPGLLLVWGATLLWAFEQQTTTGWVTFGVATAVYAAGLAAQFVFPGRRLKEAGVDTKIIAVALVVAVIGIFVIPIIGAPIGFVGTVYLLERLRQGAHPRAWAATKQALRAVLLSMGIELLTAVSIIATWVVAVFVSRPA